MRNERQEVVLQLLRFTQARDVLEYQDHPVDDPGGVGQRGDLGKDRHASPVGALQQKLVIADHVALEELGTRVHALLEREWCPIRLVQLKVAAKNRQDTWRGCGAKSHCASGRVGKLGPAVRYSQNHETGRQAVQDDSELIPLLLDALIRLSAIDCRGGVRGKDLQDRQIVLVERSLIPPLRKVKGAQHRPPEEDRDAYQALHRGVSGRKAGRAGIVSKVRDEERSA